VTPEDSIVWQYPNTVAVVVETLQVTNPTSGCSLYVHIHRPANAGPGHRVPGVVFAPGGTGYGSAYDFTTMADEIASDGFAFLHFDPDGRGLSGAYPENYDGHVHQDGMHACLLLLAGRDYVDADRLGVYTQSYGITMGSGMIARYAEPRVEFLLDFEGPADR
jgi:dipeptidyl aminopeptidase/acylaminoacyl peptidase